jgi:hypothetical protein
MLEFFALYIVPQGIVCLTKKNAFIFITALLAVACIYEAGLIQNDIYTPSKYRSLFMKANRNFYLGVKKYVRSIIVWRYILAALLTVILYFADRTSPRRFTVVLLSAACVFSIHSGVRGRWRLLTEGILHTLQCAAIPFLFLNDPWHVTFAFILAFVLRRVAETAALPEYDLPQIAELFDNPASFYISYYGALEIAAFILLIFWKRLAYVLLTLGSWYLLFTLVNFVFGITQNKTNRNW